MHMKRTNLVLDEAILREATHVLGAKTHSAAVNQAMEEVIRIRKIQSLGDFFGKGLWEGDLGQMRQDRAPRQRRRAAGRR
jgi:Arc/MetJ family transcription regulator